MPKASRLDAVCLEEKIAKLKTQRKELQMIEVQLRETERGRIYFSYSIRPILADIGLPQPADVGQ